MLKNQNLNLFNLFNESLKAYTSLKDDFKPEDIWQIDLSKPDLSEANSLINIYSNSLAFMQLFDQDADFRNFITYLMGSDALAILRNFEERIGIILPELLKILKSEATEEDYEELAWQNKFAKNKKALIELANKAKQSQELVNLDCQ